MEWLVNASQMKNMDQYTIQTIGIPSLVLMERAALAVVDEILKAGYDLSNVLVVCGSGNNGGDGFAVARLLSERGCHVTIGFAGKIASMTQETAIQRSICEKMGLTAAEAYMESEYSLIVDAVLGIGISRNITGACEELIDWINLQDCPVVAVDIPSGVNASTGQICGIAVKADLTVTFACRKIGQILYPGTMYCGTVVCRQIGILPEYLPEEERKTWIYSQNEQPDLPVRSPYSNKGTYGKVLLIAGSKGMSGAACLAAEAAYRSGCGLVQVFTPEENRQVIQTVLPEAIVTVWPEMKKMEETLQKLIGWADAVAIGPGIGMSDSSAEILRLVLENCKKPTVIDADGLNQISKHGEWKEKLSGNHILTPHIGEMMRLTEKEKLDIQKNLIETAQDLAKETGAVVVLKDARTICASGEQITVNTSGNDGMACGGSGDVLAGLIVGLLAQKMDLYEAARCGVYLHGCAGDAARKKLGARAMLAGDLICSFADVL